MSGVIITNNQKVIKISNDKKSITISPKTSNIIITSKGSQGVKGDKGNGVPEGGAEGQSLRKIDGTDNNTEWSYNWTDIVTNGKHNGTTADIATGTVYEYIHKSTTIYRFISTSLDSNGYPQEDSFYSTFDGSTLTNLIITRG